jgi:hypothetical protein
MSSSLSVASAFATRIHPETGPSWRRNEAAVLQTGVLGAEQARL